MDIGGLLTDALERVRQGLHGVLDDIDEAHLTYRPDPEANTIAWLVWHLTRIQDDHVAAVAGTQQCWRADGFCERFGLPFEPSATGWGQSAEQVGTVRCSSELLIAYYDAVHQATLRYLRTLGPPDLDRVVDEGWDPPVTLGVRLVSVINDDLQHVGQAAYLKGQAERAG
ncbi:MAG TPA: DinB family protein [Acidimicrobiales bacterium]|nr:DinB family protein [Acidimicrobiales bacterium]